MAKKLPILRVAGPTILVSLILFAACTATAIFLYRIHASTAEGLAEDLDSRKKASQIETTLRNLTTLVRDGSTQVDALHNDLWELIGEARELANTEDELNFENEIEQSLTRYYEIWQARLEEPEPDKSSLQAALRILEREAIPSVVRLRNYNSQQIEKSEEALQRTVKWIAWALVAVGTIGSLGGILLGYGVARALRSAIYKLSVRIRDAADKLRQDLPTVTITDAEGMDYLHEQMQGLMHKIEQTIDRLHQREREVLRAEQLAAVGQLAAGVAHELRNPLTAVKMLVQTSREDLEARGLPAEDLQIIEQEVRRLERSLQTFLDFARPPRMERRHIKLNDVIEEALALVGGRARKQKVDVVFAKPEPAHGVSANGVGGRVSGNTADDAVWLEADADQLRQLLINLALNALDAMPQGGKLWVEISPQVQKGMLELHVRDSGPGIVPEILPRLFEPFVSGKETGLGLGLVVSRRIAEEHGGTLEAANHPQGGACFTLRLPAATPVSSAGLEASTHPMVPVHAT